MALSDPFGRQFHYVRLSITDVCNFSCDYCLPDGYQCDGDRNFLSVDEIRRVSRAFANLGVKKIRITGGEPSLRKDLPEIIQTVAQTPGIERVALTTNGHKMARHLDKWQAAGLHAINVSVDSLNPHVFHQITGHNSLTDILDAMNTAQAMPFDRLKLNAVLMKGVNAHELESYMGWLKDKKISLRFIELMETGDTRDFFKKHHSSGQAIVDHLIANGWEQVQRGVTAGPAQEYWHPDWKGRVGVIMPYSKDFCESCNRLRMSSRGDLHLCLFTEHGLSVRHLMQKDEDIPLLMQRLQELLHQKHATHYLPEHQVGATRNLSSIGG
ncbi:GTP 3',8-cyclase MoaA [Echinimonas agarilytica]|uniref:GTP 3',8-cyclase n=1 Tax=Echinimonas agarilytica TaxID=1215918 RepID=A0AA42B7D0_9GAMM|nr:GTP 3',8-cyclase MoaA [Echinimonas agarilytica]MCM2679702.1 GTP 3',8-cyclase MoaA [Echinimonas agarilytica]